MSGLGRVLCGGANQNLANYLRKGRKFTSACRIVRGGRGRRRASSEGHSLRDGCCVRYGKSLHHPDQESETEDAHLLPK
jgi:hypothetical protein